MPLLSVIVINLSFIYLHGSVFKSHMASSDRFSSVYEKLPLLKFTEKPGDNSTNSAEKQAAAFKSNDKYNKVNSA